jgi:hypothetical protein
MRKIVILAAIAAVIAAAAGLWSTFDGPKVAVNVQATEAPTSVSPNQIMVKQGKTLRAESWDAF